MAPQDPNTYFQDFEALALRALAVEDPPSLWLDEQLKAGQELASRVVAERRDLLTENDRNAASGYLATGYYWNLDTDTRIAAVMVGFDLAEEIYRRRLECRFARYEPDQPLFRALPSLLASARESELLPSYVVGAVDREGVARISGTYCTLDPMLPASIVHWARHQHPAAPLYLRLDPAIGSATRPRVHLQETVLVPADPRWWSGLSLHTHRKAGGVYRLDPPENPADDLPAFMEYHRGLRRLETIAQRRKERYLSMMLEELELRGDLLIGRCIHCDTQAPLGTSPSEAELSHIDLAINIYAGESVDLRLEDFLKEGKVSDATFRTHLLRMEAVPAEAAVQLAFMFFRSKRMIEEMVSDQFAEISSLTS